ncbi:MAG: 30S ribosomal protein S20 [Gammaproteobacteria bacterium]|nr:30S ribosomal protein S20 [Gammaproteobacteria bacterium]MDD9960691.1 30S ribosomal protein S20 [Gammaproteobacteria bacterium]MDE0272252.1 30S ribosomal protein S20 [Gammaproteobacteria bacterium]MXX28630.1 30S ribosomal protein S20 [Gammaproteobacteria bacterium]MXY06019.1 30S ribosomal protein S20 [Gammaproteobacteria bacterium]
MANSPQSRKRARQAETRRRRNASQRSMVRTSIKKVRGAIADGDAKAAAEALDAAVPVIDRMANRGIMHPNQAARHKSRLSAGIRNITRDQNSD